ncbi:MAG: amidohydrolase family protein [Verrucomicrobiota bacterium]|nr:amidohydrolase family protein [Verrucomicrobiota bacterium]
MRLSLLVLLLFPAAVFAQTQPADTIFVSGNVYTVNDAQPQAEAIAIKADRIVFVGSSDEAKKYAGTKTRTIDLKGKTVVPGLTDSHYHLLRVGERLTTLNLDDALSKEAFLSKVKTHVAEVEPGKWVTGRGWIETFWKPAVFPTRQDLDQVAPRNPVFLARADGHGAVANTEALAIAGIDAKTPNPFGGEILRDKKTGEASGMLLDNAMELVQRKIPRSTGEENEDRSSWVRSAASSWAGAKSKTPAVNCPRSSCSGSFTARAN